MSEIGSLVVTLEANMAQYATDMGRAAAIAEQRSKEISKAIGSITGALGAIGLGVSIVGVFHELKTSIDAAIDSSAQLENLANRTGATVEGLSALSNVARFSEVSTEDLSRSLSFLSKTLIDAENGGKKSAGAFAAIGLSVKELAGLKPDQVFTKVALAMNQYLDGTEKLTVQQALMGKGAAAMLPMFKDMANAGDMVATTTTEMGKMSDEYHKSLTRQQIAHEQLAMAIAQKTLPVQMLLTQALHEFVKEISSTLSATKTLSDEAALKLWAENTALAVALLADSLIMVGRIAAVTGVTVKSGVEQMWDLVTGQGSKILQDGKAWREQVEAILMLPSLQNKVLEQIAKGGVVLSSASAPNKGAPSTAGLGSANGPKDDPTNVILRDRLKEQENYNKESDRLLADHLKSMEWLNKNELFNVREAETTKQTLIANELAAKELIWAKEEALINASIRASKTEVDRAKGHEALTVLEGKQTLDRIAAADAVLVSQRRLIDVQLELNLTTTEFVRIQRLTDEQAKFDIDNLGKSTLEVLRLTAARKIQLDTDEKIRLAQKKDPEVDTTRLIAEGALASANAQDKVTTSFNKQQSAVFGVNEAFRKYSEDAMNVGAHLENVMVKTFKGMEDALVTFVQTGKLNFSDLANSIINDLIRIAIQRSITGPLAASMFSTGGSGLFTAAASFFGFAGGGDPPLGQASMVGENGPELFVPHTSGTIIPNNALGGSGTVVNIIESPGNGGQVNRRNSGGVDYLDVFVEKVKNSLAGDISRGVGSVPNAMASTYGLNRVAGVY